MNRSMVVEEKSGVVTHRGNPLTLVGHEIREGDQAPDFHVIDSDENPVNLYDYQDKIIVISSVPSIDTPVCDLQTRRFAAEAKKLSDRVVILTISMDLPFAQKRWLKATGITGITMLSDHREADFGEKYGLLIKENHLLARAVMIVDRHRIVRYKQLVTDITNEPDYQMVIDELAGVISEKTAVPEGTRESRP